MELQFLSDGMLFQNVAIQCKTQAGFSSREENEYIVDGTLMDLHGRIHVFSFTHAYSDFGQEMGQDMDVIVPPTVCIGPHQMDIRNWELEIRSFVTKIKVLSLSSASYN